MVVTTGHAQTGTDGAVQKMWIKTVTQTHQLHACEGGRQIRLLDIMMHLTNIKATQNADLDVCCI